jgi:hypothetical protein
MADVRVYPEIIYDQLSIMKLIVAQFHSNTRSWTSCKWRGFRAAPGALLKQQIGVLEYEVVPGNTVYFC